MPDDAATCPGCGAEVPLGLLARLRSLFRSAEAGDSGTGSSGPTPTPASGAQTDSFVLVVEDVFTITGRGTVVTGKVSSGSARVGDSVTFRSQKGSHVTCRITGIEMFRKIVDEARSGDTVGLVLSGKLSREDIPLGARIEAA
jgi:elongation factor Tu